MPGYSKDAMPDSTIDFQPMATLRPERILPTLGGRCKPFTTAGAPVVQWRLVPASYHALFCLFGYHRQHPPTACSTPGDQTPRALKTSSKPGVIAGAWVLNFADSPPTLSTYLPSHNPRRLVAVVDLFIPRRRLRCQRCRAQRW